MEDEFWLINKKRTRVKLFKKFADGIKGEKKDFIEIKYGVIVRQSSKPSMKGSRIESMEIARNEWQELIMEGWQKTSILKKF